MNKYSSRKDSLKLKLTSKGLKGIIINSGIRRLITIYSNHVERCILDFKINLDEEKSYEIRSTLKNLLQLSDINKNHLVTLENKELRPQIDPLIIKKWENLLLSIELGDSEKEVIITCCTLWLDENAELDFSVLKDTCHALGLVSTCFLCSNGNFIGDISYIDPKFINCAVGVGIADETRELCSSFEEREVNDD